MVGANHSPEPPAIKAGHELSDLKPGNIALFGIILAVTIILSVIATYLLFDAFRALDRRSQAPVSPLSFSPEPTPEPRLTVNPGQDLKTMRAAEDGLLNNYGWVDQEKGIARIPIEDAIQILAQKGLPARQQSSEKQK
jgi:hypothetical protein